MSVLASFHQSFTGITADSRQVKPGALFLAYPGTHSDGRNYIASAIKAGAAGVIWDDQDFAWQADWQVSNAPVTQLKQQVGALAAEFFGHPSQQITMVGVTGTKQECLAHIDQRWTDMRPLSLRRHMEQQASRSSTEA